MNILSIALGGCLRGEPVSYGITEDTGGHITYILGEMHALARHPEVRSAEIVTRMFDEPSLGSIHAQKREELETGLVITRIDSGNRRYLSKDDLRADRLAFTRALIDELRSRARLPDLIHAHFADAADVAAHVERSLGIPFVYTAHSLGMDKLEAIGEPCDALEARIEEEDRAIARAAAVIGSSRDECERQLLGYPSTRQNLVHRVVPGITADDASAQSVAQAKKLIAPFLRDLEKPIVLAIARPVHKKNLRSLVEAFAPLKEKANLVIAAGQRVASNKGEAEQVEVITGLLHEIDRRDLYGSVAYPKQHTNEEVAGLYALAARSRGVFVNPALMEPFGLTVLEAGANGLPVVATKIGGPLDTLAELQHGQLVDPKKPSEITEAIDAIISDTKLWSRYAANGITNTKERSWTRYADSFLSIAREVTGQRKTVRGRPGPMVDSLFVSDLDNTLTGCSDGVARLREFLHANPNFAFAIATGRSIIEARRIVREWGIPSPVAWITSVGTELYWSTSNGPLRDLVFPALGAVRWSGQHVDRVMSSFPHIEPQAGYEQRSYKRSYFFNDRSEVETVSEVLRDEGLPVRVVASHDRLLDLIPLSAGKAAAMRHVGGALGIASDRIFAAGDSGNDEDMLIACENAILVRNHSTEMSKLARRSNVYFARGKHGSGAIEGIEVHARRRATGPQPSEEGSLQ